MVAGVAYGSLSGFGCGTGARDWRIRSSWTFFIGSPPRRHSLVERARPRLARLRAPRGDDRGEIGRPGPQQRQETLGFEPLQFRLELIEAYPPEDLEELVLLEPESASLREQFEDLLPKPAIHGPRLLGPERSIDHLDLEGGGDPFVERVQAVLARDVTHGDERLRAVVIRLPDQILESPLAHDVEDRQVHLNLDVRTVRHGEFDLADPGPDRVHVRLLVFVEDETANEGGLPDPALPQEGQLRFHATDARHRRTRPLRIRRASISCFVVGNFSGRDRRQILSTATAS